ncbi:MAG TPA: hypothetical protein VJ860_23510, partial [Polyangia bacterium]|nr:hypothetical protein [Polyangia bacterium]
MRRTYWMLSLLAGLGACSSQDKNTKIVVVVWSDLTIPTEMDRIQIDVQGPTAASPPTTFPLTTSDELPAVLVLVPPNNQDWPFAVTASGLRGDSTIPVVSQKATVAFLPGESRVLTLFLGRSCPGGICAQIDVPDPHTLPVYDPKATLLPPDAGAGPRLDGGSGDVGAPDVGAPDVGGAETKGVDDGGPTRDGAVDMAADVPVLPPDSGVGDARGAGGTGGSAGVGGSAGAGGTTAAIGGAGGGGVGGAGGIAMGGTGGSTVADAAVDTLVTPDAAPDLPVVICGASGEICCTGNACRSGGCCVSGTCVAIGQKCSTGGTCSNGSCTTCDPASTAGQACTTGVPGICAPGTQTCTAAGVWGTCVQNVARGTRNCSSSLDNDCDGVADSASSTCLCQVGKLQACSTGLKGICAAGTQQCVLSADKASSAWGACVQTNPKGTETCANAGADDDCDGIVDNCNVNGLALGACLNGGIWSCVAIGPAYCQPSDSNIGT